MLKKLFYLLMIFSFCVSESYSQENDFNKKFNIDLKSENFSTIGLKDKILSADTENTITEINQNTCLLYTSPSPRDRQKSRMPSSA